MITIAAPAKVNLTLEVLGRREDGYHEVSSLMQAINLCDTLSFEETYDDRLSLSCSDRSLHNDDNLVLKAANLIRDECMVTSGARIVLSKRIPAAGGLGGGSSDAAAAIRGLNNLWRLNMSVEYMQLLGARIGSDIPFFVRGGTAVTKGRGEQVYHIPFGPNGVVLLLFPQVAGIEQKTASLYAALQKDSFSRGERTEYLVTCLRDGRKLSDDLLFNVFDNAALQAFGGLGTCWDRAESITGRRFHLAGSGPTLFGWYDSEADAARACGLLEQNKLSCLTARTL